jgi:hypothetical protein
VSATRLVPSSSDWRRPPAEWFDPVPDPSPTWLNAFAKAESNFRDEVIMQKLTRRVRDGERVFAVIGGTHVVMQKKHCERVSPRDSSVPTGVLNDKRRTDARTLLQRRHPHHDGRWCW